MRKILGLFVVGALLASSSLTYAQDPSVVMPADGGEPTALPPGMDPAEQPEPMLNVNSNTGEVTAPDAGTANGQPAKQDQAAHDPAAKGQTPAANANQGVAASGGNAPSSRTDEETTSKYIVLKPGASEKLTRSIEVFGPMPLPKEPERIASNQRLHEKETFQVTKSIIVVGTQKYARPEILEGRDPSENGINTLIRGGEILRGEAKTSFKPLDDQQNAPATEQPTTGRQVPGAPANGPGGVTLPAPLPLN